MNLIRFREVEIENGMNFQKLVNRALYLYNNNSKFKEKIEKTVITEKY